ncbi:MAG: hypothetical protein JOS17DRAFT_743904 [Linnemannia elongata]|nr:MAG: hypothetical protein JOS17DRAFT_743904 [Linnemannia elongata]
MDALSRARHRQSMRLEGEEVDDDEDEEDDDEDYPHGIPPPEKWHYSDLEDEDEEEEDENDDDDSESGERRKRHESFMSAKSTFMPNGSSVSLVSAYAGQDDDDDDSSIEGGNSNSRRLHKDTQEEVEGDQIREREIQEVQSTSEKQQQQEMSSPHQDFTPSDFVKGDEYTADRLTPIGGSDDEEDRNGEDEDESEDSDDLEDNDDEEGQDRRIYLQQLRHQAREARRLERLANGGVDSKNKKKNNSNDTTTTTNAGGRHIKKVPSIDSTGGSSSGLKKKTLRKGHSKENLRDQDRPQTPTTPVPTTQIIPLTPTDLVLIRQKLFAAGNFEASMRMLDTIFHAAMAKMVEGRERGIQTEPMAVSEVQVQAQDKGDVAVDEVKKEATPIAKGVSVSTSTSTETDDMQQGDKKKTWVDTAVETPVVAPVEDDDDEDRVVEWLLAGW